MALKDRRYSITSEFTGHISGKKRFVVRFCNEWVSEHETRHEAEQAIASWKKSGNIPTEKDSRLVEVLKSTRKYFTLSQYSSSISVKGS